MLEPKMFDLQTPFYLLTAMTAPALPIQDPFRNRTWLTHSSGRIMLAMTV